MRLNTLKHNPGAKHRTKRHGKTCGKGHKGQKARAGGAVRIGFEGGQMPLHRRLPKKGFSNVRFATTYQVINLSSLAEQFEDGAAITPELLYANGAIRDNGQPVKILGDGDFSLKVSVRAHKVSASAREKIEKAGGSIELIVPRVVEKPVKKAKPVA